MKPEKALSILKRYAPCVHDGADARLGISGYWAHCEDCGVTFQQGNWDKTRKAGKDFEDAIETLELLVKRYLDTSNPVIQEIVCDGDGSFEFVDL